MPIPGIAHFGKVTFFFSDGEYTWSETHWRVDPTETAEVVMDRAKVLAPYRLRLLGVERDSVSGRDRSPSLDEIRVSFEDVTRDSKIDGSFAHKTLQYSRFTPPFPPEPPYHVLKVRMDGGIFYRKTLFLGGVPDAVIISRDRVDPSAGGFRQEFDAWANVIGPSATRRTSGWGFLVRARPAAGIAEFPLGNIRFVDGVGTIVTVPGHPFLEGTVVHVRGGSYQAGGFAVRGDYRVHVLDVNNFTLVDAPAPIGYLGGGFVMRLAYVVVGYSRIQVLGTTHRKRGIRVGYVPRGRTRRRSPLTLPPPRVR
jgi:hypothetical protein